MSQMEKSILFFFAAVILLSVGMHIYLKVCECWNKGKVMIEDDTIKNC